MSRISVRYLTAANLSGDFGSHGWYSSTYQIGRIFRSTLSVFANKHWGIYSQRTRRGHYCKYRTWKMERLDLKRSHSCFCRCFPCRPRKCALFSRFALLLTPVHQPLFLDRINTLVWKSLFQPSSRLYWIGNRPKKELEHDDAIREDVDIVWPYLKGAQKTMP